MNARAREREDGDYDKITKTCYFIFDVGQNGEKAGQVTDQLAQLAGMGSRPRSGRSPTCTGAPR